MFSIVTISDKLVKIIEWTKVFDVAMQEVTEIVKLHGDGLISHEEALQRIILIVNR